MRRVTKFGAFGEPIWEEEDDSRWQSPYHQSYIEVDDPNGGFKAIPVAGIRKSSRLIRSEANKNEA